MTTTDTTERQVIFNPGKIVRSLIQEGTTTDSGGRGTTTNGGNRTHLLNAVYSVYSGKMTVISISQPEAAHPDRYPGYPDGILDIWSGRFMVTSSLTGRFLDAQNDIGHGAEYRRWKLGVGIGVGLGAPILMAVTALGTWIVGKRIEGRKQAMAAPPKT